ncbi:prepilin peptidase [Agromyces silvae]|uniref:prepilin peptidase n=1 Tax=Agromyces silvae TaxID=3388266 RepID=UPI00280AF6E8|nr:A24 family peptidase [Agromyces protaetiae]
MPLEPGFTHLLAVVVAAMLGGVLGWWPLAAWAQHSLAGVAVPGVASSPGDGSTDADVVGRPRVAVTPAAPARPAGPAGSTGGRAAAVVAGGAEAGGRAATGPAAGGRAATGAVAEVCLRARAVAVTRPAVRATAGAVTACVWGLAVWRLGLSPVVPAVLVFLAAATVLALVDLRERRLPNRVTGPAFVVVAVLLTAAAMASGAWAALLWAVLGGAAMFVTYLLVALASPAAMGMGDVKLAGLIGLVLGWFGFDAWLIGLLAAFVLGGSVAIIALALRRVTLRTSIPFGPSMLAGALLSVLLVA